MTRLARPVNLEAGLALATAEAGPAIAMPVEPVRLTFAPPEAEAEVARVEVDPIEAAPQAKGPIEAASVAEAVAEAAPEAAVVTAPEAAMADPEDDLTQLVGVGPRTALALKARGVTRFAHLAAWSPEQLAAFDAELNLKGRGVRDAWIAQARRLSGAA
jgi:predicted flap endonuclease-1-like 5' DNA nuclease